MQIEIKELSLNTIREQGIYSVEIFNLLKKNQFALRISNPGEKIELFLIVFKDELKDRDFQALFKLTDHELIKDILDIFDRYMIRIREIATKKIRFTGRKDLMLEVYIQSFNLYLSRNINGVWEIGSNKENKRSDSDQIISLISSFENNVYGKVNLLISYLKGKKVVLP